MGKEKTNKHKEFWRDTPWCASRLSRGHVPSVPWYVPSVPGTFCPFSIDLHINQAQMSQVSLGRPEFVPGTPPGHPTAKSLYVIFLYRFFLSIPKYWRHLLGGGVCWGGLGGVRSIRVRKLVSAVKVEGLMSHWFVAFSSATLDYRPLCSRAVCQGSLLCLQLTDQTRSWSWSRTCGFFPSRFDLKVHFYAIEAEICN